MKSPLFYLTATTACLAIFMLSSCTPSKSNRLETVITIKDGHLSGSSSNGAVSFLGIPYGADTGGANRFLPPKSPKPWAEVRDATRMGNRCPQPSFSVVSAVIKFSDLPISEDCLVLNVWSADTRPVATRPVMVWLHGGGFSFGSASDKYYDGTVLAREHDVVVVTVNHRLNGFGYLNLGPEAGEAYASSPLVGQLDIVKALKWVETNIEAFGGDPDNVTIFGQSGGGGKVSAILAMPNAKGLFDKAIIQSGAGVRMKTVEESIIVRDKVLAELNLEPADVLKLRDVPMAELVEAFKTAGGLDFHPVVDGKILPAHPFDPVATPLSADIPIMIGLARDEATSILHADPTWPDTSEARLQATTALLVGADKAELALELYRDRTPNDPPMQLLASIIGDQMFVMNTITLAERKSVQPAQVYMYRVEWKTPVLGGILRAPHGIELPFVFGTVDISPELVGAGPSQNNMMDLMGKTFSAFAHKGNPNVEGYPTWQPYNTSDRMTFIYDDPPRMDSDPDSAIRVFWTGQ